MDIFTFYNRHKKECNFCAHFQGENEWLKPAKPIMRRRARRKLKQLLK